MSPSPYTRSFGQASVSGQAATLLFTFPETDTWVLRNWLLYANPQATEASITLRLETAAGTLILGQWTPSQILVLSTETRVVCPAGATLWLDTSAGFTTVALTGYQLMGAAPPLAQNASP